MLFLKRLYFTFLQLLLFGEIIDQTRFFNIITVLLTPLRVSLCS
ncbi:hypothetical protein ECARS42123_4105 [Escherichia coli ARS4.2123]|nr:hypothetical protein ECARS42123_4105 [Escherichia coli ARS4.2123]